jgi:AcrR family transcriptional regulator
MIEAGLKVVEREGLGLSLDRLGLEQVIAEAGVARASVYRRWPHRDAYLSDLLVALAQSNRLDEAGAEASRTAISEVLRGLDLHIALGDQQARRDLLVEALRASAEAELAGFVAARRYHRHLALMATAIGLPDGELRGAVSAALAAAQRLLTSQRAHVFAALTELIGYRLRAPLDGDHGYQVMSAASGAAIQGLVVRAVADHSTDESLFTAHAFGSSQAATWSVGSYTLVSVILGFIEPDAEVVWDGRRIGWVAHRLTLPGLGLDGLGTDG